MCFVVIMFVYYNYGARGAPLNCAVAALIDDVTQLLESCALTRELNTIRRWRPPRRLQHETIREHQTRITIAA